MAKLQVLLDPSKMGNEAETLKNSLQKRVVGQEEAIRQIVNMYQTYLAGMAAPGRPVGNLLFLGPTGSGKTRTVEALAESLVGDASAVIKIDCGEFQHSHEIAKLIGSPPGYLGHRETHPQLSQEVLNQHFTDTVKLSFVLFDEIEKASDALWNLLLGILDKATLTLGDNRRVDFSQAMIFMTSNLGAGEISTILRPSLGFSAVAAPSAAAASPDLDEKQMSKIARAGVEAARRRFTPEFLNRIDKTVVFHPLSEDDLRRILEIELEHVEARIAVATGKTGTAFTLDDPARDLLLAEGTDARYGARHLKRAVECLLVQPMANLIATGQVGGAERVYVVADAARRSLVFSKDFPEIARAPDLASGKSAAA
jgi:ATP-dependent Clp protease ATP-binding subunit ClpA